MTLVTSPLRVFTAHHEKWGPAAKAAAGWLGQSAPEIGLVYAAEPLAPDLPSILTFLRETVPGTLWVGAGGETLLIPGLMTDEEGEAPTLAVVSATLPAGLDPAGFAARHGAWAAGATGDGTAPPAASGIDTGAGPSLVAAMCQGCFPIGPAHIVTSAIESVVMRLDGQAALSLLKEDAGDLIARDLARAAGFIHAARPPAAAGAAIRVVPLLGIDRRRGWIALGDVPAAGEEISFVWRDAKSAQEAMATMLADLSRAVAKRPILGGLYFTNPHRSFHIFGGPGHEIAMIRDALGDFPLVGLSGARVPADTPIYGYTGVLALFL